MLAMYKNRNTGTGNGMRGTRGMGECYIPGNVTKHSGESPHIFWGMSPNIPGNVLKDSGEGLSAALLLYASFVATRKIQLTPRGSEPGTLRRKLAATTTMLQ